jgi:hypothetical protein
MSLRAVVFGLNLLGFAVSGAWATAETCTTQSQMKDADRDSLAAAARDIAAKVQANNAPGLRSETVAEFANNFAPLQSLVADTAPKLSGGELAVDQVYLLDATQIKAGQGAAEAQFFCSLNRSANDVEFLIPGLSPGVYGFAVVRSSLPATWVLPMLLKRDLGKWLLAGIYPHATEAAGHDGLWYWREARRLNSENQHWNAWLYYGEAEFLLKPANFLQSSHLEKLRDEQKTAAPPALSAGIGTDVPLVVKAKDGQEYQFTSLTTEDSLAKDRIDVSAHLRVDQIGDVATARKRNEDAMRALVSAYPELRGSFHGVWIVAETAGQSQAPFATEEPMSAIH